MAKYGYNDNESIGTGAVKCAACGQPLREHKLTERCPELGDERVTVARPRKRETNKAPSDR